MMGRLTALTSLPARMVAAWAIGSARGARLGLVDLEGPPVHLLSIERSDRGLGRSVGGHLDKGKASRPATIAIGDHVDRGDLAVCLKELHQPIPGRVIVHVANVQILCHLALQSYDVDGLRALGALLDGKLDALLLLQVFEAFSADARVVDEYVLTDFALDKTITLLIAEPLDGSCLSITHYLVSFHWNELIGYWKQGTV